MGTNAAEVLETRGEHRPRRREDWPRWPVASASAAEKLRLVMESGRWSISGHWTGSVNQERLFAQRFAEFHRVPYCVPTASGTSSIVIALQALEVGPGDEIIVPGLVWVAPAVAVLLVNAVPVLVDVHPETLCMDVDCVEAAVTPRTRAILAVHLYCSMVEMDALRRVAARHGLAIIEDCAQSHGSMWRDEFAGTLSDVGVFSMHEGKVLTCGEGGAAITRDARLYDRMEQLRSSGRRYPDPPPPKWGFDLEEVGDVIGVNYALSEIQAALLLDGLERLDEQNRHREGNARYLDAALSDLGGITPIKRPAQVTRQTYYHYLVRLEPEQFSGRSLTSICQALQAELGFWVHPIYPPLNRNLLYNPGRNPKRWWSSEYAAAIDPARFDLPRAEAAHASSVVFHHSVLLAPRRDMDLVVDAFARVKKNSGGIP